MRLERRGSFVAVGGGGGGGGQKLTMAAGFHSVPISDKRSIITYMMTSLLGFGILCARQISVRTGGEESYDQIICSVRRVRAFALAACHDAGKSMSAAQPATSASSQAALPDQAATSQPPLGATNISAPSTGGVQGNAAVWTKSVNKDAMSDKTTVILTTRPSTNNLTMSIACEDDVSNVGINLPRDMYINHFNMNIKTRIDQEASRDEEWCYDHGGPRMILCIGNNISDYIDYIKHLVGHNIFRIRIDSEQRGIIEGEFTISGLADAMQAAANSCNWSSITSP